MIQGRSRARFPLKPFQGRLVIRVFVGQKLQGNRPAQAGVFRLVDHTHAAAPQYLQDR
jgi:hypothetical protein